MDLIWVRGLTPRVSLKFCVPCNQVGDEELKARFFEEINEKAPSAYVHLEGLAKSFSLMCSPLQSGRSWTRGFMSYIPKVFFCPHIMKHFLTLRPHFFVETINFAASVNESCAGFV